MKTKTFKNFFSEKMNVPKNSHCFFRGLYLITVLLLICDFCMS